MGNGHKHLYEFGRFALDVSNHLLLFDGKPIPLQPKAFDTLLLLIERRGEVLTKDELLRRLWPDSFVEESNLSQNIYVLRKILAQSAGGDELIKTVPKRGYRFVGHVREVGHDAELILEEHTWTQVITEEDSEGEAIHLEKHVTHVPEAPKVFPINVEKQKRLLGTLSRSGSWIVVSWQRASLAALVLVVIVTLSAYAVWRTTVGSQLARGGADDSRASIFQTMKIQRLTDIGKAFHPAISPDGKYLAYVARDQPDHDSLWIKHIPSGSAKQLVPYAEAIEGYEAPTFSPDSSFVYFIRREKGVNTLYRVAILGDVPRKLIDDIWGRVAVSPDGRQLAFVRTDWNAGEHTLVVANADGTGERPLAVRRTPEYFNIFGVGPAWSPDGKTIASSGGSAEAGNHDDLILVDVETGTQRPLSSRKWRSMGQVVWLPDGAGLLVAAIEKAGSPQQVWYVSYSSGEARRITNDLNDYEMLSITAEGNLVVAQQSEQVSNLWILKSKFNVSRGTLATHTLEGADAVQISSVAHRREGFYGIAWTPDFRIVYSSNAGGLYDLWIVKPDGSDAQRLTQSAGESNIFPTVSPDGRFIVFSSDRGGTRNIWRIDGDGRNPVQLTHGTNEYHSAFSSDGQWVFYESGEKSEVWKVPVAGGQPVRVIGGRSSGHPVISPDGLIAYTYYDEHQKDPWRVGVMKLDGSAVLESLPQPFRCFEWTPGARTLTYLVGVNTVSNLWSQPLDGHAPVQLTNFKEQRIYWFAWSPEGRYIALARGEWSSDVVTISDLK